MNHVTTYLSPNGQPTTVGDGPATRLLVATLDGVCTLGREIEGAPWTVVSRSLADQHIGALLYEPGCGKLFAASHKPGGLWVSDDGAGGKWRQVSSGIEHNNCYSLAAHYVGDQVTLYMGTEPAALYRSDDLGENWRDLSSLRDVPDTDQWTFPPPPFLAHVKNVAFRPDQPETLYASIEQGGVFRSRDGGESWTELASYSLPDDIAYRDIHQLLIHPESPDLVYMSSGEGLHRSSDGGENWEHLIQRGHRLSYPDFLRFDPRDPTVIYLAGAATSPGFWRGNGTADAGILRSSDGGDTWHELTNGLPQPMISAYEGMTTHHWPDGVLLLLATATGEIYASENDGQNWACIAEEISPVSKDGHYVMFLPQGSAEGAPAGA